MQGQSQRFNKEANQHTKERWRVYEKEHFSLGVDALEEIKEEAMN